MRRPVVLVVIVALLLTGACSGDDGVAGVDIQTTTSTAVVEDVTGRGQVSDRYGVRYCEVLTITIADTTTAEVWGTQGLNDCPQAEFEAIDLATAAAELQASIALRNGPRYWVLDSIAANQLAGSGEIRDFGGIEMRSLALVDLGPGVPSRSPYRENAVRRDTEFVFDAGREVYELIAADGSVYVMQSYSLEVDPSLTVDDLAALGDRLALPDGWTFASRVLDERLVVEDIDGFAPVIQDELLNSYQLRSRG
jgi:hypothetical protein